MVGDYASVEDMIDDILVVNWIEPPEERTPENYRIKLERWVIGKIQTWMYFEALNERLREFEDGDGI